MSFFEELKRRNVFRVGIAYLIGAWVLAQVADLLLESFGAPDWVMKSILVAFMIGFPVALFFAWAFELTPDGVKREAEVDRSHSIAPQTGRKLDRAIIVVLALAVVFLLYQQFSTQPEQPQAAAPVTAEQTGEVTEGTTAPATSQQSIAVLPFRDMSAAGDQAYFGEGIAEELLNSLVKLDGLKVASRTSSFSLAGEGLDIPAIAQRLNVTNILEGSIRTSGQQVRVTAQLIDVSQDIHLWSETYNGTLDDIFKIQDEITSKITEAMKVQLGGAKLVSIAEQLTSNPEAYQMYLQGRHLWRQRGIEALHRAVALFQWAVELDPDFHQAWSNMGLAYFNLPDYDASVEVKQSYEDGVRAADRALAIAPDSSEALILKANYLEYVCKPGEAAGLYQRALANNPEDPTAHHWYQILLAIAGQNEQALHHIIRAREIDPLISPVIANQGQALTALGQHEEARKLYREANNLGFPGGGFELGKDFLLTGELDQAIELMKQGTQDGNPDEAARLELFFQALRDPDAIGRFNIEAGTANPARHFDNVDTIDLLVLLGSDHVFDFQSEMECPAVTRTYWLDTFREQRATPAFFDMMKRAGYLDFWREYGWPDDCASLDQELAECPKEESAAARLGDPVSMIAANPMFDSLHNSKRWQTLMQENGIQL